MNKRIIYFAGYKGHRSNKFEIIKEYFTSYECIQFDQTLDFAKDIIQLEKLIVNSETAIIASSMGCLSALYIHFKYRLPIVLINPSLFPDETLSDELTETEKSGIRNMRACLFEMKAGKEINLFIAEDDERVNHKRFIEQFADNIQFINRSPIGGHSYSIIKQKLKVMSLYLSHERPDMEDFFAMFEDEMVKNCFGDIDELPDILPDKSKIRTNKK